MSVTAATSCIVFQADRRIADGPLGDIVAVVQQAAEAGAPVLVLEAETSRPIDLDLRGAVAEVLARLAPAEDAKRGPGRPKLGVTAREVTLLPRQWEWLAAQPGGASTTLRRLVDEARKAGGGREDKRARQEAAYRFMTVMAGDRPGYEDAVRALYAADADRLAALTADWPADVREHARGRAQAANA
jgi:hypothetical protein